MTVQLKINPTGGGKSKSRNLDLSDAAFGIDFNEALVHQVVVAYQAGRRAGTRAQKNRAAVRGGGAKPWRQKGGGRARAGSIRSPIFRGGGVTFPATTKDFSHKVNRKMYRAAMRSILSELHRQERLVVVDQLAMDAPSTKQLAATLRALDAGRALVVLAGDDRNVELSARNLASVEVCVSGQIDPVSLISYDKVVVTVDAARQIDEALQ
ncbi:MAG: 50S ribosomal protein L4 [Gammaproteobacteria bacterium]|nr:50S ribosomal protein L4 [Gammaproteobacteria bacterium]